jgi:hypothetical protein
MYCIPSKIYRGLVNFGFLYGSGGGIFLSRLSFEKASLRQKEKIKIIINF